MTKPILIKNGTLITLGSSNRIIQDGAVLIDGSKIKAIGKTSDFGDIESSAEVIDAKGKLIMPGFINQHMHFYSTFARGIMPKQPPARNFVEVLEKLWWPLDETVNEIDMYYSSMIPLINGIKNGTTCVFDHHESQGNQKNIMAPIEKAVRDSGVRANLALGISDRHGKGAEGIEENIRFIENNHKHIRETGDDIITSSFGIHALFTVNEKSLEAAAEAAKGLDVGFHIHCAEDIADQIVNKNRYGKSVIRRLYDAGGLGEKTTAIHCIYLNDEEIELLSSTQTPVVHIPQSNMNNAVGVADVLKMMSNGILVGIGTDGMTPRMQDDVRVANILHKLNSKDPRVFFCESCQLLLENNAKITNRFFSEKTGVLEPGAYADIILIDYLAPTPLTEATFFGHFLFGICEAPVDSTIVNGRLLMKDRKLTFIDEEKVFAESRKQAQNFWERFYKL